MSALGRVRAAWRRLRARPKMDGEAWTALGLLALAVTGWWVHSLPLAILGSLGALSTGALYLWQRQCLTALTYRSTLGATRASFGEEVSLDIEIVNDKVLPVAWLHAEERVPVSLDFRGATVTTDAQSARLVHILPVLPYQRVRRRVTVVCCERGLHRFGPATLRSGDPIGLRERMSTVAAVQRLLVYPKVFALEPVGVAARSPLGDVVAPRRWLEDPSRIAGVREYRPGDPLRAVDWRATARSTGLLVRQFQPTVDLQVAVFVDFRAVLDDLRQPDFSCVEFVIAVAASVLCDLAGRRVPVGLFASGAVGDQPLAYRPSGAPGQVALILEALARCDARERRAFPAVLATEVGRLRHGTSVIVISPHFHGATLDAMAELRRRHAVTSVWVRAERGAPPPTGQVDVALSVEYTRGWRDDDTLQLAA